MHCKIFSSISALYPLHTNGTSSPAVTTKNISRHGQVPSWLEKKIGKTNSSLVENNVFKGKMSYPCFISNSMSLFFPFRLYIEVWRVQKSTWILSVTLMNYSLNIPVLPEPSSKKRSSPASPKPTIHLLFLTTLHSPVQDNHSPGFWDVVGYFLPIFLMCLFSPSWDKCGCWVQSIMKIYSLTTWCQVLLYFKHWNDTRFWSQEASSWRY